jgi:CheY-like chemotaxis protein
MSTGLKVLVIDDDQDFRASLRPVLEQEGYAVLEAETGGQGLRKLLEHRPDVLIVDIMMESSTEGYGLTQAIRWQEAYQEFRRVPIIMVSSIEETPDERFFMAAEVDMIRPDQYLTKPLDIPRFLEVLKRLAAPV